jgi:hypothetical protein
MDIQDFLDQGEGKEEDKIAAWNLFQQAYELQMKGNKTLTLGIHTMTLVSTLSN